MFEKVLTTLLLHYINNLPLPFMLLNGNPFNNKLRIAYYQNCFIMKKSFLINKPTD